MDFDRVGLGEHPPEQGIKSAVCFSISILWESSYLLRGKSSLQLGRLRQTSRKRSKLHGHAMVVTARYWSTEVAEVWLGENDLVLSFPRLRNHLEDDACSGERVREYRSAIECARLVENESA
jgi:hypothetical protein